MTKKKWLTLSLIGTALLLIPRRSSRQTVAPVQNEKGRQHKGQNDVPDNAPDNAPNDETKVDTSH